MNRLKEIRILNKETQSELGKILNLSKATISKYESGDVEMSNDVLIAVSKHYNVSIDYILGISNDEDIVQQKTNNNIKMASASDIDLAKYAKLDKDKKEFIEKQLNAMIDMFLKDDKYYTKDKRYN